MNGLSYNECIWSGRRGYDMKELNERFRLYSCIYGLIFGSFNFMTCSIRPRTWYGVATKDQYYKDHRKNRAQKSGLTYSAERWWLLTIIIVLQAYIFNKAERDFTNLYYRSLTLLLANWTPLTEVQDWHILLHCGGNYLM